MAATNGSMHHLSMAACEWFLMILMFIDAALGFLLTKFAHYCQLQTPCLFCLRLDHFFGNEEPQSYLSLFCSKHRAEISSLMYCDLHDKLADIREMCDDCVMSIKIQNQSNSESYGIMEGQMGIEGYLKFYSNKNFGACSCCKRQLEMRSSAQRLVQPGPVSLGTSRVIVKPPVPRDAGPRRVIRRGNFKKAENSIGLDMDVDVLPRAGYAELKFNLDSDSDFPFSDDDNATLAVAGIGKQRVLNYDSRVIHGMSSQNQDRPETKDLLTVSDPRHSLLNVHHDETNHSGSLTLNGPIGHELARAVSGTDSRPSLLNGHHDESMTNRSGSLTPSPIGHEFARAVSGFDPRPSLLNVHHDESMINHSGSLTPNGPIGHESTSAVSGSDPRPLLLNVHHDESITNHSGSLTPNGPIRHELATAVSGSDPRHSLLNVHHDGSITNHSGSLTPNGPIGHELDRAVSGSDPGPSLLYVHHDESITNHSGSLTPNGPIGHELARAVSGPSVPQEVKESSPLEVGKNTESLPRRGSVQDMHLSNSDGIHEKNDGYESPGGSSVSDIEGESLVDKLKRQVEHDRKCLRLLQAELEEERNAADIAANEAMAMITRLQEEKSALHMEALQYLRMVEEQVEYDMEALDKANGLVDQKDKEIQDLEAELEYFRSRYDDELMMGNNMVEIENLKVEHMGNGKIDTNSSDSKSAKVLDLEDEKRYIFQSLSELERKIHQFSSRNTSVSKPNGNVHAEKTTNQDLEADNRTQLDHSKDENSFSIHKDLSTSNGIPSTNSSNKRLSMDHGEFDAGTFTNEISDLHERMEALEADRDFLEHACNALQSSGGFQFIQEIANNLQDLRKIRFDRRCLSVS